MHTLQPVTIDTRWVVLPLTGTIGARKPLELLTEPTAAGVPRVLMSEPETFALRVRGDGLLADGRRGGDILVVRRQGTAEPGQTVIAMIDGAVRVTAFREGVKVRGVVVALIRRP